MEAKERVARRFLDFLSKRVPLPLARLATLGGMGVEAQAWLEAGIPPEHGSLIELESGLARKLISRFRYRTHDRLNAFHTVLGSYSETVDGFHLDLCGTFNIDVTGDFSPTLPFILRSQGRCLAVTMADARQNRALSHWTAYRKKGGALLGRGMRHIFAELEAQQRKIPVKARTSLPKFFKRGFDPHKGAKREFAFMTDMAELFASHKCAVLSMERLVYVSRYKNRPFRMRTYFFHLGLGYSADAGHALARTWTESPLVFIDKGKIEVTAALAAQHKETPVTSLLADLVALTGNEAIRKEYEDLVKDSQMLASLRVSLNGGTGKAAHAPSGQNGEGKAHKKKWSDLSPVEKLEFRLKVCKARHEYLATGTAASWAKERLPALIKEELGHVPKSFPRTVGAFVARMNGSFRGQFIEHVKGVLPAAEATDYISRLSAIPK